MRRRMPAASLLAALIACAGCGRVRVENDLGVAIPGDSLARLKALAADSDFAVRRIEFRVCFHPCDQAVAMVRYAETGDDERVIRRSRIFTNASWPSRRETGLGVAAYPASLRPPAGGWKACEDSVRETLWHRFRVGGGRVEAILGKGVTRVDAQELLEALKRAVDSGHAYVRGCRLAEAYHIEKRVSGDAETWTVWYGPRPSLSSRGAVFRRENGRSVITAIACRVS